MKYTVSCLLACLLSTTVLALDPATVDAELREVGFVEVNTRELYDDYFVLLATSEGSS